MDRLWLVQQDFFKHISGLQSPHPVLFRYQHMFKGIKVRVICCSFDWFCALSAHASPLLTWFRSAVDFFFFFSTKEMTRGQFVEPFAPDANDCLRSNTVSGRALFCDSLSSRPATSSSSACTCGRLLTPGPLACWLARSV